MKTFCTVGGILIFSVLTARLSPESSVVKSASQAAGSMVEQIETCIIQLQYESDMRKDPWRQTLSQYTPSH